MSIPTLGRYRRAARIALAAAVVLGVSGCQGAKSPNIRIGVAIDEPGMSLLSAGVYSGFDIDVASYVANALGKTEITYVRATPAQRDVLLTTGQVDIVVAAYAMTDASALSVAFAGPYLTTGQTLLVRRGSRIAGPDDMPGHTLCTGTGTPAAQRIVQKYPGVQLQTFDSYARCVALLDTGQIDAVTGDQVVLAGFARQPQYADEFTLVGKTFSIESYAVGLPKDDSRLCRRITTALTTMVSSGAWQRAVDKNLTPLGVRLDPKQNPPKLASCR
ncbi:MAG TPA: transporter substrate-binding domain-containing protein [Tetrasphaera sp.]|uniref:transporter substrate-binding domain-containing protein n=1 Tax=Nostocoides sp. TaxID=1917966 RepID=UPI002D044FCC|nr:transporter substrate-binding domain-containing protein [Tetrasphaera sp.]HNQ07846.1 transporter substrate-binding domain-containing protein [Tetrasphaera sp.]